MSSNRKKILLPLGIVAGGLILTTLLIQLRQPAPQNPPQTPIPVIRVHTVTQDRMQLAVNSQGSVVPRTESTLISQVAGQVVYTSPKFAAGGFFEKGELLLRVDDRDYQLQKVQAASQVAQAELLIAREQEEARIAKEEWQRLGKGTPTDLVLRKPQFKQAQAALQASQAALQMAELNIERTRIRAPYIGRVRAKNVDIGQVVAPGTPLGLIYAVDYAEVKLPIPDEQLQFLSLPAAAENGNGKESGPAVQLLARFAGKQHEWQGRIVRVEGEIDPRTRMVNVIARVNSPYAGQNGTPPLKVGMFVQAEIQGKAFDDVFAIPRVAMRNATQVLVVNDGKLQFRTVQVLRTQADTVLISAGLQPGEQICISPLDVVVDGMQVRIEPNAAGS